MGHQVTDDRRADLPPGAEAGVLADRLKERIYATITMIAVVVGHERVSYMKDL
ncbi:hypothetical protein [Streptomyces coeruleorubidus]|uniref:hypothetical protein n=1 Tax=Streptomyces coeruleorubidus TaxID=116188 RepID=UPI00340CAACC